MRKVLASLLWAFIAIVAILVIAHRLLGGSTHTKADYARAHLRHLGSKVESYRMDAGHFPATLRDLVENDAVDDGEGPYAREREIVDPWGREYYYRAQRESEGYVLFSLGADGSIGGVGEDADLAYERAGADG